MGVWMQVNSLYMMLCDTSSQCDACQECVRGAKYFNVSDSVVKCINSSNSVNDYMCIYIYDIQASFSFLYNFASFIVMKM